MIRKLKIATTLALALFISACGSENSSKSSAKDNGMGEFLPVEKAFVFSVDSIDSKTINAHWEIADGYHLYKDKFEFALVSAQGNEDYQIASLNMPKGKMIDDKIFGNKESYEGMLDVRISLKAINESGEVVLKTSYQGCSEKGLCYPPQNIETVVKLKG